MRNILKNNRPVIFKSIKVTKVKERLGNFQTEGNTSNLKLNEKYDAGLDSFAKKSLPNGV